MSLTRWLSALALALAATPVAAQDTAPGLAVELNAAADQPDGSCRLTFVAFNGFAVPLDQAALTMEIFDTTGNVRDPQLFDFGAMPVNKTRVVRFDIAATKCADISRIIVNDAAQCLAGGQPAPGCLETLAASSRTPIQFGL
jgi:hypothetical protein